MWVLTGRGHLTDSSSAYVSVGLWREPNIETARNISCAITIVGYPVIELFPGYRFG
jgi:hypothetical protein